MFLYLCIFVVLYVIYKGVKRTSYWKDRHVEATDYWPFVGHMGRLIFRKQTFAHMGQDVYNKCSGRYCGIYHFMSASLLVKDLELLKKVTIKDFDHFTDHYSFGLEKLDPVIGKSLFFLKGQKWKNMRSTLSPAFTGSKMRILFLLMRECAEALNEHFLSKEDVEVEMKDTFSKVANDVITSCALGVECNSLKDDTNVFYVKGKELTNFGLLQPLLFMAYMIFPKLIKSLGLKMVSKDLSNFYHDLVINNIETRERDGIVRKDVIHLLMEARNGQLKFEDPKTDLDTGFATAVESTDGNRDTTVLTDEDILSQAVIFLVAGYDTVSTMISFTAYEIAVNPDVQKRLQDEIDDTKKSLNGPVTFEALIKMKYLDMVLSETLRKWPVNLISDRICTKPYTIEPTNLNEKPVHLKQGDSINIPIFAIQRDPKYFPDPEKFDPERFSDENKANIEPTSYVPFGIGPRNCIGSRFALIEIKVIIYYLLSKFDLVVCEKTQIPLQLAKGVIYMAAEKGIWLKIQKRKR